MKNIFLILCIGLIFGSCTKENLKNCKFSSGEITTEVREVEVFNNIVLRDNVNLILEGSGEPKLIIETGKNLIDGISTEVNEKGSLIIRNNNTCDWARDYNTTINVYLQYTNIDTIEYRSIGDITTIDTLVSDTLWLTVYEGAGEINMTIDVARYYCQLHYGTVDIITDGNCGLSFVYSASFGLVDLRDLHTNFVYVANRSSNNVFVNSNNTLEATISNIGDIYYSGNPGNIVLNKTGSGNLIKLE